MVSKPFSQPQNTKIVPATREIVRERNITVEIPSAEQEADYLVAEIMDGKAGFDYAGKGYELVLSDNPRFLAEMCGACRPEELKKIFLEENIYNKTYYDEGKKNVESILDDVFSVISRFPDLVPGGFQLYDTYKVVLTAYGPGGSWFGKETKEGDMIIYTSKKGEFKVGSSNPDKKNPIGTIVFCALALGVENDTGNDLVKHFGLGHFEKMALVDKLFDDFAIPIMEAKGKVLPRVTYSLSDKSLLSRSFDTTVPNLHNFLKEYLLHELSLALFATEDAALKTKVENILNTIKKVLVENLSAEGEVMDEKHVNLLKDGFELLTKFRHLETEAKEDRKGPNTSLLEIEYQAGENSRIMQNMEFLRNMNIITTKNIEKSLLIQFPLLGYEKENNEKKGSLDIRAVHTARLLAEQIGVAFPTDDALITYYKSCITAGKDISGIVPGYEHLCIVQGLATRDKPADGIEADGMPFVSENSNQGSLLESVMLTQQQLDIPIPPEKSCVFTIVHRTGEQDVRSTGSFSYSSLKVSSPGNLQVMHRYDEGDDVLFEDMYTFPIHRYFIDGNDPYNKHIGNEISTEYKKAISFFKEQGIPVHEEFPFVDNIKRINAFFILHTNLGVKVLEACLTNNNEQLCTFAVKRLLQWGKRDIVLAHLPSLLKQQIYPTELSLGKNVPLSLATAIIQSGDRFVFGAYLQHVAANRPAFLEKINKYLQERYTFVELKRVGTKNKAEQRKLTDIKQLYYLFDVFWLNYISSKTGSSLPFPKFITQSQDQILEKKEMETIVSHFEHSDENINTFAFQQFASSLFFHNYTLNEKKYFPLDISLKGRSEEEAKQYLTQFLSDFLSQYAKRYPKNNTSTFLCLLRVDESAESHMQSLQNFLNQKFGDLPIRFKFFVS